MPNFIKQDTLVDLPKTITRIEVIDRNGRSYINTNVVISEMSLQDDERTLKIFINTKKEENV